MTALGDILAARAGSARARGTVELGALGLVTVEALPIREIERLSRGADADRAVFYAACREMQSAGAALLREGKVYRPDQVMALVSDAEAAKAAEAVRTLSGWPREETNSKAAAVSAAENADGVRAGASEAAEASAPDTAAPVSVEEESAASSAAAGTDSDGQAFHEPEVRPEAAPKEALPIKEIQQDLTRDGLRSGQASHEFPTRNREAERPAETPRAELGKMADIPQSMRASNMADSGPQTAEQAFFPKPPASEDSGTDAIHEYASERTETPCEAKAGSAAQGGEGLRESEPEWTKTRLETTSDLAERVARELLDGLRRASWVR